MKEAKDMTAAEIYERIKSLVPKKYNGSIKKFRMVPVADLTEKERGARREIQRLYYWRNKHD
jgi:hypothetical protein